MNFILYLQKKFNIIYFIIVNLSNLFFQVDLEHQREVTAADGMALAHSWGCPFIEASAKNRCNVNEVFAAIVREMNYSPNEKNTNFCCCVLL